MMTSEQIRHLTDQVQKRVEASLSGAKVVIQSEDGHHFSARVVYAGFAGLNLLEQHRMVYDAIGEDVGVSLHAVSLSTHVIEEAEHE